MGSTNSKTEVSRRGTHHLAGNPLSPIDCSIPGLRHLSKTAG